MYYVYVLHSRKYDKFYIGYTSDLRRRLAEHIQGKSQTTKILETATLMYYEGCVSKRDATFRERQLKTGFGRGYLRRRLKYALLDS